MRSGGSIGVPAYYRCDRRRDFSRERAMERLINRALILQQAKLQPQPPIHGQQGGSTSSLMQVRTDGAGVQAEYHCETEAGWDAVYCGAGLSRFRS